MNNRIWKAARFDTWQLRAIKHFKGPMMVLAGPGSGKTTVLTNRIRFLTGEKEIPEERILVITFTRFAAEEMKKRYLDLSGKKETQITFGTFHSVFYRIIRRNPAYRNIQVATEKERLAIVNDAIGELYGKNALEFTFAEELVDSFGKIRNGCQAEFPTAAEIYRLYEKKMQERNLIDFDGMLSVCCGMIRSDETMRKELSDQFRFILIDEFQDIDCLQYETVKLISGKEKNVFIVGDDDQSIYGFRGSDPSFMKLFMKEYRGAEKVILSRNYRSTGSIVKASGVLIGNNRNRYRKKLRAANAGGIRPSVVSFTDESEEAKYIEETIRFLRESAEKAGYRNLSAAVLARTHEALAAVTSHLSENVLSGLTAATFHASKGLEFDVVFIVGANEGITPEKKAVHSENIEEERRTFYVAMTRAKKFLHILYTETCYNKKSKVSRFVKELL